MFAMPTQEFLSWLILHNALMLAALFQVVPATPPEVPELVVEGKFLEGDDALTVAAPAPDVAAEILSNGDVWVEAAFVVCKPAGGVCVGICAELDFDITVVLCVNVNLCDDTVINVKAYGFARCFCRNKLAKHVVKNIIVIVGNFLPAFSINIRPRIIILIN